jgi:hypothetical protein
VPDELLIIYVLYELSEETSHQLIENACMFLPVGWIHSSLYQRKERACVFLQVELIHRPSDDRASFFLQVQWTHSTSDERKSLFVPSGRVNSQNFS